MSLNFIFSNLNIIVLVVWVVFFAVVVLRFMRPVVASNGLTRHNPAGLKNISYSMLVGIAIGLHIFYGAFVTWGQYHVWATSSEFTQTFVTSPLPNEVPLGILEGLRGAFDQPLGYFTYYVFGRIWLDIIILFALSGFFYSILKIWSFYRGGFLPHGTEILLVLMLISGYPGILILVPLGFVLAFASFGIARFRRTSGVKQIYLEPSFIIATPIAIFYPIATLLYIKAVSYWKIIFTYLS